jgi:hypothetical protein
VDDTHASMHVTDSVGKSGKWQDFGLRFYVSLPPFGWVPGISRAFRRYRRGEQLGSDFQGVYRADFLESFDQHIKIHSIEIESFDQDS